MQKFKGITISTSQYKDNDFIINILTQKGQIIPVTVRSGMKQESANKEFQYPFVIAEFETYSGGQKYEKLRCGNIEKMLITSLSQNFKNLEIYGLLTEILKKFPPLEGEKNFYTLLDLTINNLCEKDEKLKYTLLFLIVYIKLLGYNPMFNIEIPQFGSVYFNPDSTSFIEDVEINDEKYFELSAQEYTFLRSAFSKKYRELEQIELEDNARIYIKFLLKYLSAVSDTKIIGFFW